MNTFIYVYVERNYNMYCVEFINNNMKHVCGDAMLTSRGYDHVVFSFKELAELIPNVMWHEAIYEFDEFVEFD